jgi:5-bromo-4-chloroindolyl phosphate hydrolysis protein
VAGALAGAVGGGLFLLLWLLFGWGFLPSLLFGAAGFGAGMLAFRRRPAMRVELSGVNAEMRSAAVREGREKLAELSEAIHRISGPARARFDAVRQVAARIVGDLERNSRDVRAARQFLGYYLDATIRVCSSYAELASTGLRGEGIAGSLARTESLLDAIRQAFEQQHAKLLAGEVLDLDTEIALLEKTMRGEGIEAPPREASREG